MSLLEKIGLKVFALGFALHTVAFPISLVGYLEVNSNNNKIHQRKKDYIRRDSYFKIYGREIFFGCAGVSLIGWGLNYTGELIERKRKIS
jgi:hypothetical protein